MYIGVDVGGTKLLVQGERHDARFTTGATFTPDELCRRLDEQLVRASEKPLGLGIAVPGLVDLHGIVVAGDVLPQFVSWSASAAARALGLPVTIVNDVKACSTASQASRPAW